MYYSWNPTTMRYDRKAEGEPDFWDNLFKSLERWDFYNSRNEMPPKPMLKDEHGTRQVPVGRGRGWKDMTPQQLELIVCCGVEGESFKSAGERLNGSGRRAMRSTFAAWPLAVER